MYKVKYAYKWNTCLMSTCRLYGKVEHLKWARYRAKEDWAKYYGAVSRQDADHECEYWYNQYKAEKAYIKRLKKSLPTLIYRNM